jgi:hypothetical protein
LFVRGSEMSEEPVLTDDAQKDLLRRCWYSHDARWFTSVADEFGVEAANRLNRRVCRALGEVEMRRFLAAFGIARPRSVRGAVEVIDQAMRFFVPAPMTTFDTWVIDGHSYGFWIRHCFIYDNVTRAGIASSYCCAAFDRVQGWHDALNLPLAEDPPVMPCAKTMGQECLRVMTVQSGGIHRHRGARRARNVAADPAEVCN